MATVRPFRGVRYVPERVDLGEVLAPAGALDDEARAALYAKEPRNAARVVASRPEPGEPEGASARRAALFLAEWQRAGVLAVDDYPAFYVLRQTFPVAGQQEPRSVTGFFGALVLDEAARSSVKEHEAVDEGAVDALSSHLAAVRMHTDPMLLLYEDDSGRVGRALLSAMEEREPDVRARLADSSYELWVVDDETTTARVARHLEDHPLYVADGHHRFRAALALERMRAQAREPGALNEPTSLIALFLSKGEAQDGVAPIHRQAPLPATFDPARAVGALGRFFARTRIDDVAALPDEVRRSKAALAFGLTLPGEGAFLFTSREEVELAELPNAPKDAVADASYLEPVLLSTLLEVEPSTAAFLYDEELRELLARGLPSELCVVMRPPTVDDVIALADRGRVLPEKSTSFTPKSPRGFVFSPLVALGDDDG